MLCTLQSSHLLNGRSLGRALEFDCDIPPRSCSAQVADFCFHSVSLQATYKRSVQFLLRDPVRIRIDSSHLIPILPCVISPQLYMYHSMHSIHTTLLRPLTRLGEGGCHIGLDIHDDAYGLNMMLSTDFERVKVRER